MYSSGHFFQQGQGHFPSTRSRILDSCTSSLSLLLLESNKQQQHKSKDDITLQLNVIDWVVENGGYFNPKQEIRRIFPGGPFGIFATSRIEKGELIASVPWKCVMTAGTDDFETFVHCGTTQFIIDEMHKGDASFFAPYTAYLLSAPPVNIPSMWSDDAKNLLKATHWEKQNSTQESDTVEYQIQKRMSWPG